MIRTQAKVAKPKALKKGARLGVFAPASPGKVERMTAGIAELKRIGFEVVTRREAEAEGYFAASTEKRREEFLQELKAADVDGLVALRGGYGANYLLDEEFDKNLKEPKCLIGFSDITTLQVYLWEKRGWVTVYGPMVAAGFDIGVGAKGGYDEKSFFAAVRQTNEGWDISLHGECLVKGEAQGRVVGGCMTLVEATFGTPWELDTRDAILVLEDRAMKPYQVDRVLMHFLQAGKLAHVKGIVLGDFPECEPPVAGSPTVRDVCARILGPLGVPVVFGVPFGHTERAMLTLPLGVEARLDTKGEGVLEILEPVVRE